MDLLKKETGTTMIETLVGITLLGLIIVFSFTILTKIFSDTKLMRRQEAYQLANQEITNCINSKLKSDTTYKNLAGNLIVMREVLSMENNHTVTVKVMTSDSTKEIVSFSSIYVE